MPLMISRIGHARGRPVPFAAGRCGLITRHSLSVTSVWYRFVSRICCFRVVGVHMVSPGLVSATPWNHADPSHSTSLETASYPSGDSFGQSMPMRFSVHTADREPAMPRIVGTFTQRSDNQETNVSTSDTPIEQAR